MKRLVCGIMAAVALIFGLASLNTPKFATSAQSMLLLENSTNRVLYEKNADKKLPMASTTKIATAITVIENCSDLEKTVKVPKKAVGVEGSSIYLEEGEELKVIDLLYGLMLQSGNDCAVALALTVGGSIEKFAELMNETALKAGAINSNFVNPHGLHDDNHFTTARDLALISSYAMKNPIFEKIVSAKRYTMPWKGREYDRVVLNKNKILSTFDGGDGIKTGFTKKAGRCLVSSAKRNGMRVICVVLNCGPMFEDCSALMEKAFGEFKMEKVCSREDVLRIPVVEGKSDGVDCAPENERYYPLREGETALLKTETETAQKLTAPVKIGEQVGKIKITLENHLLFEEKLVTINSVDAPDYLDRLGQIIGGWTQSNE